LSNNGLGDLGGVLFYLSGHLIILY
jgi:hypothetical protein